MGISKVEFIRNGTTETLVDLTGDTVTVRYTSALSSSGTVWFRFVKNKGAV